MTGKEAIAELKTRYFSMSQCLQVEELHKANEAIDLAIEALQAEHCEDCISFPKGTLKKRGKGYVVYNVEWLKKHWQTELKVMGIECEDASNMGKWEYLCYQNMKCSRCGYVIAEEDNIEFRFCPNCGCRMGEGE